MYRYVCTSVTFNIKRQSYNRTLRILEKTGFISYHPSVVTS